MNAGTLRGAWSLILVLAGLSAASPLATDMYVPALPEMANSLGAGSGEVQASLTGFLVGVILGQLVWGPMSDAVGRRPVLLWGTSSFAALSVLCALAPTAAILDAARVGQGLAGAAGIVVARAVVTDLFEGHQLARVYSVLGAVTSMGPVLAPLVGAAVLTVASWRSVFVLLALIGLAVALGVGRCVPETRVRTARTRGGVAGGLRSMGRLARRREVLLPVVAVAFGGAAVFAYIAGTSFVFQELYHLTPAASGLVYGANAVGNVMGSLACGRLARRWRAETLLVASAAGGLAATATLAVVQATVGSGVVCTWACLFAGVSAFGVFFPAVTAVAQSRGRDAPGAASALLGCGQFAFSAAAAPAVGWFGTRSPLPMALIMTCCLACALLAACFTAGDAPAPSPVPGQPAAPPG
ncbi:MFS transporter, DHA1 family, bicyclomycin/chloramphenicol resistance protein [Streptomyces sp. WMMB 714]|uniref:multidrug effflux MFS transporter n=1 Tax=Streptomyces sp. WMMB 714 TaxID=1286822 RepID=UPI0005F872BE|nr:multidrug effflux MFS transporter [Streptomyces sp. WMMB 714]SCK43057.1 MFS transporter, DHA1 family, bicyclomycin/chloramphenicol resistance protein [Streptomyces sp. WMMB 714]